MTTHLRHAGLAAVAAAGLALAACGGNNNDDQPPVTESVPASASASVGGFVDYLMRLVGSAADMLDPVDVSAVLAPTDEVSEPTALP